MQEETKVLGENLHGQVWIENQIHIRLQPDWESSPGRIGERHGNNRCTNPPRPVLVKYDTTWISHQVNSSNWIHIIYLWDRVIFLIYLWHYKMSCFAFKTNLMTPYIRLLKNICHNLSALEYLPTLVVFSSI